jgi:hypothetical protein
VNIVERKSIHCAAPAARVKLAGRRFVNYRQVDADYPSRLIGGSNGDSEIFAAIYRRPTAISSPFLSRAPLVKLPEITTARTATLKIIRTN